MQHGIFLPCERASNGKPQFLKQIFSQQSNGAVTERVQRFGGQDKTALRAVPVPSRQPEPLRKVARSQTVNTKPKRSQKYASSTCLPVQLVLRVKPIGNRQSSAQYSDYSRSRDFRLLGKRTLLSVTRSLPKGILLSVTTLSRKTASRETHTPLSLVCSRRLSPSRKISIAAA